MGSMYEAEKLNRRALADILQLISSASRYTSKEIIAILESDHSPAITRKLLYRVQRLGYVSGGAYRGYKLTNRGASRLSKLSFELIDQTEPWDHMWRLVIYDIPEEKRIARNQIRRLVKKLGFEKLQQSIWAHPLPCTDEFQKIRDAYNLNNHLILIETLHSKEFDELFEKFKTKYSKME